MGCCCVSINTLVETVAIKINFMIQLINFTHLSFFVYLLTFSFVEVFVLVLVEVLEYGCSGTISLVNLVSEYDLIVNYSSS